MTNFNEYVEPTADERHDRQCVYCPYAKFKNGVQPICLKEDYDICTENLEYAGESEDEWFDDQYCKILNGEPSGALT